MKLQIAPFVLCAKDHQGEEMFLDNAETAFVSKFVLCTEDHQGEEMSLDNAETAFVSKFDYDIMNSTAFRKVVLWFVVIKIIYT